MSYLESNEKRPRLTRMPVVVIVVLGGRWIPLDAAGPAVLPILFVHLGGLGVELGSHDAQAFGAREVETASRDPEAIFSLATQELGTEHFGFSAGNGRNMSNARMPAAGLWFLIQLWHGIIPACR